MDRKRNVAKYTVCLLQALGRIYEVKHLLLLAKSKAIASNSIHKKSVEKVLAWKQRSGC